jgi:hypothetical protein
MKGLQSFFNPHNRSNPYTSSPLPASSASNAENNAPPPNLGKAGSKPYENIKWNSLPYFTSKERLYHKIAEGRAGSLTITDFCIPQNVLQTLSSSKSHRIRLFMGNPQYAPPFGDTKQIDVLFSESCYITVNDKAVQPADFQPSKKKLWACIPPDITHLLHTRQGVCNRIVVRFSPMMPVCSLLIIE